MPHTVYIRDAAFLVELQRLLISFDRNAAADTDYLIGIVLSGNGAAAAVVSANVVQAGVVVPRPKAKAAAKARARSRTPLRETVRALAVAPPSPRTPEEYVEGCKLSFFVFYFFHL